MKKFCKVLTVLYLVAIAIVSLAGTAYATYESEKKTLSVYGHEYEFNSTINNATFNNIYAGTRISSEAPSVPIGYMGVQPRLYNSSGALYASGKWEYNTYATRSYGYAQAFSVPSNTYFYSEGAADLYNGDGYTRVRCTRTPNYMSKSSATNDIIVEYNENGEIFGSMPILEQIDVTPDLILAIGINGELGYVRADDLDGNNISTPEQAMAYMNSLESEIKIAALAQEQRFDTIPLYESDGVTVIGAFAIFFPDEITS